MRRGARLRRACDCAFALGGLVVGSVPLALGALAIRLSQPGSVVFRQVRIGRGGRPFELYKLRTMRPASGAQVTSINDARITPVGRVLRTLKIDEVPQLWNVLRGDMGIIGPRPEVPRFVARYSDAERAILDATPGLASLSQLVYADEARALAGHPNPDDAYARFVMPLKIAVDLQYERTRTFMTDLTLMADVLLLIAGRNRRADPNFRVPLEASRQ